MSPALAALRSETSEVHARLHLHPAFAAIMRAPPDVAGYAALVGWLHGFHAPVEAWLFGAAPGLLPELTDLPERRKAHLLRADMHALAAFEAPRTGSSMPRPGTQLSRPALLGCLYVVEGSTLGGRGLGRALQPVLRAAGLQGAAGVRFFLAYGTRQAEMWHRFCGILDVAAQCFSPADLIVMTGAAQALFLTLENWLTECQMTGSRTGRLSAVS